MHAYECRGFTPGRVRFLESLTWVALGVFVAFLVLSFWNHAFAQFLQSRPGIFIAASAVMYVVFLIPTRQLGRYNRYTRTSLDSTRKGFTLQDRGEAPKTWSWRDLKSATVVLDALRDGQIYVRRVELEVPKARIKLENEPPRFELQGALELMQELRERTTLSYRFMWYFPVCPFCRTPLKDREPCSGCGERVRFVQKLLRPQEIFREDTLFILIFVAFAFMLPGGLVFGTTALLVLAWGLMIPLITARPARLQLLPRQHPETVP